MTSKILFKDIFSTLVCSFSIIIVILTLVSVIFPSLIISNFGLQQTNIEPFEVGSNAIVLLIGNFLLFGFGIFYYKRKFPQQIQEKLKKIFSSDISSKMALIVILIILTPYVTLTIPELFIDEATQAPDYQIFLAAKEIFPFGKTEFTEASEQNDRYVRMVLLIASLEIFQNVKIIPFLGSIALLITTYFFTKEITKKRLAGIISMLVLIQSYTFLKFDSYAMYENFWVLFYILSLYLICKKWYLSPISYILSIFTKAFTAIFFPLSLVFVYYSKITSKTKILLAISYTAMLCIVIIIWSLDASIYSNVIRFDLGQILIGFTKLSYQLRFDLLLLVGILPLTIALILKARQRIDIVTPVLFLITGSIFLGPIVEMFSDFYVILPYRFIPTIVFFSVGVGILFKTKNST